MSTAYLVLLILLIVYIPIWIWVWRNPEVAGRHHLQKYGPCLMIKTQLGMRTMDRLAKYKRFWHAFGFFSKLVSAVLFFMMMYMLVVAVIALPTRLSSGSSIGIEYALAIPGFNPIMPLSYGIVALLVAMVVHELGHGIQSRVNGIKVNSSGLLYGVVPLGAFVEPDDEELAKADRKAQIDVYAAGITVNTIVALLSIFIMVGACGCVSSDYGDNAGVYYVDSNSPAYEAGIPASALITAINGEPITTHRNGSYAYLDNDLDPTTPSSVTYKYKGETVTKSVRMGTYVKTIVNGSPAQTGGIQTGTFIYSIALEGGEATLIHNPTDISDFLSDTVSGQTVTVGVVKDFESEGYTAPTYITLTLSNNNGHGYIGISTTTGGMTFTTPNILLDKAINPFYGADSAYGYLKSFLSYLSGPFNGMDPISDELKWWYDAPLGDLFWIAITMLYWLFWLDILLAISNALPTFILDGGFIFAGGVSWLLERLGVRDVQRRDELTNSIAGNVSMITGFLFLLVIVAMIV